MKSNPFLKAEKAVLQKVYGNVCVLNLRIEKRSYDKESGKFSSEFVSLERDVYISSPHEISLAAVDGKTYLRGDMSCNIAFLSLQEIFADIESRDIDTPTFGLDIKNDRLIFKNTAYRITKVVPQKFYAATPSIIRLYLRAM